MRPAAEVLAAHNIQGPDSCISWAIEFILKLHEKLALAEYPIQTKFPKGTGFGAEAIALLAVDGITAWQESLCWADFETYSKADAAAGTPLVFAIPTSVQLDFFKAGFGNFIVHACVATHWPQAAYVTRIHGFDQSIDVPLPAFYNFLRTIDAGYRIDCLRHTS
jgi:hypothetical protein